MQFVELLFDSIGLMRNNISASGFQVVFAKDQEDKTTIARLLARLLNYPTLEISIFDNTLVVKTECYVHIQLVSTEWMILKTTFSS